MFPCLPSFPWSEVAGGGRFPPLERIVYAFPFLSFSFLSSIGCFFHLTAEVSVGVFLPEFLLSIEEIRYSFFVFSCKNLYEPALSLPPKFL